MLLRYIVLCWLSAFVACAASGDLDRTFKPELPADASVTFVHEQSDGRLLVCGSTSDPNVTPPFPGYEPFNSFFARLHRNGRLDRTFNHQRIPLTSVVRIDDARDLSSGDIVVHGSIVTASYLTNNGVVSGPYPEHFLAAVLGRNGDIKYIYPRPPPEPHFHSKLRPDGSLVYVVTDDSSFLGAFFRTMYPDGQMVTNRITYLLRTTVLSVDVLPNGSVVSRIKRRYYSSLAYDYELLSEQWGTLRFGHSFPGYPSNIVLPALCAGPDDTVYLAAHRGIRRFGTNWQEDVSFHFELPGTPSDDTLIGPITATRDGRVIYFARGNDSGVTNTFLGRCLPNGSLDRRFRTGMGPNATVQGMLTLQKEKHILLWGDFSEYDGRKVRGLIRIKN